MTEEIIWRVRGEGSNAIEGRKSIARPSELRIGRDEGGDIVLPDPAVSRTHAKLTITSDAITIADAESTNGTFIGGRRLVSAAWNPGSTVEIGPFVLELSGVAVRAAAGAGETPQTALATPGDATPGTVKIEAAPPQGPSSAPAPLPGDDGMFPPAFFDAPVVNARALIATGRVAAEIDYLALGGGLGSFTWVDHLRVFGVPAEAIRVIGVDPVPYAKYKRLCAVSQIPDHERLRSNSISTPDNIWGFPGYASRETWRAIRQRKWQLKPIMQVFGEPTLSPSYTPRAGDVFASLDQEIVRIGWDRMWVAGRILKIRKTDDGRFAVAYRVPSDQRRSGERNLYMIARHIQLATGYPASRYLKDIQRFKRSHPQSRRVVNAYEEHDALYTDLQQNGGTVVVRGRGIVASRILQRLGEARAVNPAIRVLHLMRSRIREGQTYDLAKRHAANDIEFQPFNWPKSCWGGTLRELLEKTPPAERYKLLGQWGGTTTADRPDWDQLIEDGKREGWYRSYFGETKGIELKGDKLVTSLASTEAFKEESKLDADYVIDCTGLISDLESNPLLKDLIDTYGLARNTASGSGPEQRLAGLQVSNAFEIEGLRNGAGRSFAAGVLTLNGPYAAVDSFLGLQYSALRSVDLLAAEKAPHLTRLGPLRSFRQWRRWCKGLAP